MTTKTTEAVRFFREHAGASWDPATETQAQGTYRHARRLAMAEEWAKGQGFFFDWRDDEDGDHSYVAEGDFDPPTTCERVVVLDMDDEIVAEVGCIDDATPQYRRVVEAELALEGYSTYHPDVRVSDSADHVSRTLDPRRVVAVSRDRSRIKIDIGSHTTPWLPAVNYTYTRKA